MTINRWLHLLTSFWRISFRRDLFRKRIDQKNILIRQQLNCIWRSMVSKIFLRFEFRDILENFEGKLEERR